MKVIISSLLTVVMVLSLSLTLYAAPTDINDPYFMETGGGCAQSWCAGVNTSLLDPLSNMNTLAYYLNSNFNSLTTGDWLIKEGSSSAPVGDVVRFEFVHNSTGALVPVAFIYSDDTGGYSPAGGTAHPADVGLPSSYQTNQITTWETSSSGTGFVYAPTAGQPGFVPGWGYGLESYDYPDPIPEPSSLLLLGLGFLGLAVIRRKFNK